MDRTGLDWSVQPSWVVALIFFGTGVVVPIVLALIGRRRGRADDAPPAAPAQSPVPIQIESPWFVQNFLQLVEDVADLKRNQVVLLGQVKGLAKLLRRREGGKRKGAP